MSVNLDVGLDPVWNEPLPLIQKTVDFYGRSFQDFTHLVDKGMPAMVLIENARSFSTIDDRRNYKQGFGSGFIYRADGYIVTNYHVVQGASKVTAVFNATNRKYPAIVKGVDPDTDLALLKIEATDLPFLKFGDSDQVKVGNWIALLGNPIQEKDVLTIGVISGKGLRNVDPRSRYEDFIRTNAQSLPGNSGGPLLNLEGDVIGVHSYSRGEGKSIAFAISSNLSASVIDQLMQKGIVERSYFGAYLHLIDEKLAKNLGEETLAGSSIVRDVEIESPAGKAGLLPGDIIVQYGDKKEMKDFRTDLGLHYAPFSEVSLSIIRNGEPLQLTVVLGLETRADGVCPEALEKLGIYVDECSAERAARLGFDFGLEGALVSKVKIDSPADLAGIEPSFMITGVTWGLGGHTKVKNIHDLTSAIQEAGDRKTLILHARRSDRGCEDVYSITL